MSRILYRIREFGTSIPNGGAQGVANRWAAIMGASSDSENEDEGATA